MKKKIIIFEGIDGSGKTSLLKEVAARIKQKGISNKIISREITPAATQISQSFIGLQMPPEAELCLRIAREYINYQQIQESSDAIFFLDRSIVTIKAISNVHGLDKNLFSSLLSRLYDQSIFSVGIVFCTLPFEIAKMRVYNRLKSEESANIGSLVEMERHECDIKIFEALHDSYYNNSNFPNKLELNTSILNLAECTEQTLGFITEL